MEVAQAGVRGAISSNPSPIMASKEWVTIGLPWCKIVITMQKAMMHVNSILNSLTNL